MGRDCISLVLEVPQAWQKIPKYLFANKKLKPKPDEKSLAFTLTNNAYYLVATCTCEAIKSSPGNSIYY